MFFLVAVRSSHILSIFAIKKLLKLSASSLIFGSDLVQQAVAWTHPETEAYL